MIEAESAIKSVKISVRSGNMQSQPHQYTITPWRTSSDLVSVRQALYHPTSPTDHTRAITTIQAWKLRGNLPHAVESTGLLFDSIRFHNSQSSSPSTHGGGPGRNAFAVDSSFPIRAAYTIALGRFVTGFADLGRHRAGPGQTMQEVAKSINLPPHFVELRHEAAHEDMPTLGRLVKMANEALMWLWENYWVLLDQEVKSAPPAMSREQADRTVEDQLRGAMRDYRSSRIKAVKKGETRDELAILETKTIAERCMAVCGSKKRKWGVLIKMLVADNMIIPSEVDRFTLV